MESPGAGVIGNSFVSALRSRVNRNVSLYAVRYPADTEVDVGANDMSAHVQSTINGCPDTRIVLGGYSLGAAVTDVVVAAPIAAFGFTNPLPPGSDQHIAAVALFGNGSQWVGPITNFNPVYTDRTIDLCHGDRSHLQSGRPAHLVGQLVAALRVAIHPGRHGQSGRRLRRRQAAVTVCGNERLKQPCRLLQQLFRFAR